MADFDDLKYGKDQNCREGTEIDGIYYTNFQLIRAIAKTLIQKGVCIKQELKQNL